MKVFVSYSRSDAGDFANQVYKHLSSFKYDIFTDVNSIRGGDVWSKTIEENISDCDIFVVVVTHGALQSSHVEREVLQAQREKKTIIPCFHISIIPRYIDKLELNKFQGVEFDEKYELARRLYLMIDPLKKTPEDRNGTKPGREYSRHSAQWYLDKGKEWESIDENENALKQYQNAIKEEPENFLVRCELSFFLERIGKINEALEAIEQAIDLKPTNAEVWYHKARILEKLGKYEEAIVALTKDLKLDSKDIKSWTSKSKLLEKVGRYEEALEAIDKIINIDSTNIDAFEQKGKIFEKLKRYKEAISCFDKVLSIDKNNEEAIKKKESSEENLKKQKYSDLISKIESLFYKQKDYSTVIDLCDKAIDIDKENYISYLYKGKSLQQLSKYKDAISCFDKVLSIDKNNEEAINNKEIVLEYLKKQKYTEVSDELLICYHSGNHSGNYDHDHKVITLSDEAIKLYPQHYEPYLYKGNILVKYKKFDAAVECYYKAMLLNLEDSVLWIQNDNMIYENLTQYKKLNKNNNNLNYILDQVLKKTLLLSLEAHSDQVASVAISPDNKKIVSPIGKKIYILDIDTGKLLNSLEGYSGNITSVAISSDNTKIVSGSLSGSLDKTIKTIKVWDIATGKLLKEMLKTVDDAYFTDFEAVGSFGFTEEVALIGSVVGTVVGTLAISPDSTKIVSPIGKKINIWDIATGDLLNTLEGHSGKVSSIAISPDNTKIVSGSWFDKTIKVWRLIT